MSVPCFAARLSYQRFLDIGRGTAQKVRAKLQQALYGLVTRHRQRMILELMPCNQKAS
jgi:hypothetical protein